ncbi:unnamed protein product [Citrullus colocynthis]|uniref:Uncharacterized protein n=1 Tax=Citrullus colocynthis TaxID=252529 RepID=A0ABP0Z8R5_9ROSI
MTSSSSNSIDQDNQIPVTTISETPSISATVQAIASSTLPPRILPKCFYTTFDFSKYSTISYYRNPNPQIPTSQPYPFFPNQPNFPYPPMFNGVQHASMQYQSLASMPFPSSIPMPNQFPFINSPQPLPSPFLNISQSLTIKLSDTNYHLSKNQLLNLIMGHGLEGFINDSFPSPPWFLDNQNTQENPSLGQT